MTCLTFYKIVLACMNGTTESVKGAAVWRNKKDWRKPDMGTWMDTSGLEVSPSPRSRTDMINQSQMCIGCMLRVAKAWRGLAFHSSNCPQRIVRSGVHGGEEWKGEL